MIDVRQMVISLTSQQKVKIDYSQLWAESEGKVYVMVFKKFEENVWLESIFLQQWSNLT